MASILFLEFRKCFFKIFKINFIFGLPFYPSNGTWSIYSRSKIYMNNYISACTNWEKTHHRDSTIYIAVGFSKCCRDPVLNDIWMDFNLSSYPRPEVQVLQKCIHVIDMYYSTTLSWSDLALTRDNEYRLYTPDMLLTTWQHRLALPFGIPCHSQSRRAPLSIHSRNNLRHTSLLQPSPLVELPSMRLWFDDLHLCIYLVVLDFVRA